MRRSLGDGLEFDDDPGRIDVAAVHDYLANHSYWAEGRPYEVVERLVREAQRVVGVYDGDRQVRFARAFTDGVSLVYLADVYLLPEHRARASASSSSARWSRAGRTRRSAGCCTRATHTGSTARSASASRPSA